jgi:hypothetical protein
MNAILVPFIYLGLFYLLASLVMMIELYRHDRVETEPRGALFVFGMLWPYVLYSVWKAE